MANEELNPTVCTRAGSQRRLPSTAAGAAAATAPAPSEKSASKTSPKSTCAWDRSKPAEAHRRRRQTPQAHCRHRHRNPPDLCRHRAILRTGFPHRTQSRRSHHLAPRKLRGVESNCMIIAASVGPEGRPVLAGFPERRRNRSAAKVSNRFSVFSRQYQLAWSVLTMVLLITDRSFPMDLIDSHAHIDFPQFGGRPRSHAATRPGRRSWHVAGNWYGPGPEELDCRNSVRRTTRLDLHQRWHPPTRSQRSYSAAFRRTRPPRPTSQSHRLGRNRPRLFLRSLSARRSGHGLPPTNGISSRRQTPRHHPLPRRLG